MVYKIASIVKLDDNNIFSYEFIKNITNREIATCYSSYNKERVIYSLLSENFIIITDVFV